MVSTLGDLRLKHNIERAKELLPSIILTILSMIQALALELYWSRIEDSGFLWEGGAEALIGWLQLTVLLLAVVMSVATYGSHLTMRQARQDPDNDYFFRNVEPATWRDYPATTVMVVCFCLFGLVLWLLDNPVALSVLALLLAVVALGYRMAQVRLYWMHSMVSPADTSGEEGD